MLKLLLACTARPLVMEERRVSKELDVTPNQRHHLRMSGNNNYGSRDTYQNCNQQGHGGISLHFPSTAVSDTELRTLPDPAFPLKNCTLPDFPMSRNWEDIAPGRSAAQALQNEQDLSRDSHVTDNSCNHRSFTLRSIRKSSTTQNLVLTVPRSPSRYNLLPTQRSPSKNNLTLSPRSPSKNNLLSSSLRSLSKTNLSSLLLSPTQQNRMPGPYPPCRQCTSKISLPNSPCSPTRLNRRGSQHDVTGSLKNPGSPVKKSLSKVRSCTTLEHLSSILIQGEDVFQGQVPRVSPFMVMQHEASEMDSRWNLPGTLLSEQQGKKGADTTASSSSGKSSHPPYPVPYHSVSLPKGQDLPTSSTWPCLAAPALSAQVGVYIDDRGKSDIELLRQSAPISMFHHKEVFMRSELELPLGQNRTPDDSAVAFSSSPATKAAASPAGATSKLKVNMLIPVAEEEASKPPKDSLAWAIPRKKGEPRLSPNIVRGFEVKESGMRSATSLPVGAARGASPCLGSPTGLHTQEAGPANMMPRFHSHQSGFWSVMSSLASLPAVERLHHASTSSIPGGAGNKALMRRSEHHIK